MTNKILWEKWLDPFDALKDKDNGEEELNDFEEESEQYKQIKDFKSKNLVSSNGQPFLVGPMGIVPLTESGKPSKLYNFWMIHTNFSITSEIKSILDNIEGIESLDIFSRYRARLGFGKVFNEEEIKSKIENILCKPPTPKFGINNFLDQKYKHWIIKIDDKGHQTILHGNKEDLEKIDLSKTKHIKSW